MLKLNIEKPWFDYQDTRCCNLALLNVLPKLLTGPNLHIRFMKNSVYTSLLGSLYLTIPRLKTYQQFHCVFYMCKPCCPSLILSVGFRILLLKRRIFLMIIFYQNVHCALATVECVSYLTVHFAHSNNLIWTHRKLLYTLHCLVQTQPKQILVKIEKGSLLFLIQIENCLSN